MTAHRILIMGGTGVFGKRLARHLATFDGVELFISSRTAAKAEAFVAVLKTEAPAIRAQGIALDHRKNLAAQLAAIKPFAVIDCSGPFQTASYDAARAIIASGAHLIDLADARDYLVGFAPALDQLAQANSVSALTGASSTPTLSACVVDHVTQGWQRVDTIDICITPGGKSEVGRSVIEAILSYAGKAVPAWEKGRLTQTIGWTGAKVVDIPQLGRRRVARVETYDAEYLGSRHAVQSRVSFSAGLESSIEQRGIETIASLRRRGMFPNPNALISVLLKARQITRIPTSDQGGMLVEVCGLDANGAFIQTRWSLIASNDHGPFIPILPAAAALQNLLNGDTPTGAGLADRHTTLSQILAQMAPYDITTQTDVSQAKLSCFETYLGAETVDELPPAMQAFHCQTAPPVWSGQARIARGTGLIAKTLGWLFGFPNAGEDVPVTVVVDRTVSASDTPMERWTRTFADTKMSSVLRHRDDGSFTETFAPMTFTLDLSAEDDAILMPVSRWTVGQLRLPMALAPQSDTREYQDDKGRFRFDVRITIPFFGLLVHYQGWLKPDTDR